MARAVADFDLSVAVATRSGDHSSLLAAMKTMQGNLARMIHKVNAAVRALNDDAGELTRITGRASAQQMLRA